MLQAFIAKAFVDAPEEDGDPGGASGAGGPAVSETQLAPLTLLRLAGDHRR
jgi:hypothetical protein